MTVNPTPTAPVAIRPAGQRDVDTVYTFLCDLEETTLDLMSFRTVYQQNIANSMIHYLIAEQQGEPVGFVSCHVQYLLHHTGKVGEIQELYVRPDYRNQRIGQQLVAALQALAIRGNLVHLEVTTNQKRIDTIRFYERESFTLTHFKLVKPLQA